MSQIHKMYSVKDSKAGVYAPPFCYSQDGQAVRAVQEEMGNAQSLLAKYPKDFSLWCVGEWDDRSGIVAPLASPRFIVELVSVFSEIKPSEVLNGKPR